MIKKYSAFHTAIIVLTALTLIIFNVEYTNNFYSILGKEVYMLLTIYIVAPVLINVFSMLGNMISRKKWLWVLTTLIFSFIATPVYYFAVYTKQ